jgi:hypothetical protein
MRRRQFLIVTFAAAVPRLAFAADVPVTIYRNPSCGCCDVYADYLKRNGFRVELIDTLDAASIHTKFNVPEKLEGCHTAVIGKHVFEGLIPAEYLKRVVSANRPIRGLAVPGMPVGAPGMPGTARGPINVYYLDDSATPKVFATF